MQTLNYGACFLLVQLHHQSPQDFKNYDCPQGKDKPSDLLRERTATVQTKCWCKSSSKGHKKILFSDFGCLEKALLSLDCKF